MKKLSTIVGIIGPKGAGKSYLAQRLYLQTPRAIVFDPCDDLWGGISVYGSPKAAAKAVRRGSGNFHVHYIPTILNHLQGSAIEAPGLEFICDIAKMARNCTLFVDEAHLVCSPRTIPNKFLRAIYVGRHSGLNFTWLSHSFMGVAPILRGSNTDILIFFRLSDAQELDQIRKRCGVAVADAVASLRRNSQDATPQRLEYHSATGQHVILE